VAWPDWLEAEHANLAAAISWLLDQDQPGLALQQRYSHTKRRI
jgi:hypothetical protein